MTNPEEGSDSAAPKTNQVQEKEKIDETGVSKDGDAKKGCDSNESGSDKMSIGSPAKIPALSTSTELNPSSTTTQMEENKEGTSNKAETTTMEDENLVEFKVVYNKKKYEICFDINKDVGALKSHLQPIIEIPPAMMKVMIKGLAKDKDTLAQLGVNKTSKVMVIGSSLSDVLQVSTVPSKSELKKREEEESKDGGKESSESQKKQTAQKSPGKGEARRRHAGYQRKTRSTTVHTDFRDAK